VNKSIKSLLVIAAHPDDEILGCGATVSRLSQEGVECNCIIMNQGITSRYDADCDEAANQIEELSKNTRTAADIVGYSEIYQFDFPDNQFDTVALLELVKSIENIIEKVSPDTIFTHHPGDLNKDHQLVHQAALIASRATSASPIKNVLAFEIPSSTEWAQSQFKCFSPTCYFDIEKTLIKKLGAMAAYEGESREFPHPRSKEALKALAMTRGASAGLQAAEAFEVIRIVN
jgi:N-acetylglucosamine malate deacetylase 1